MEEKLFGIASKIARPMALASLIVIALFLLYRQILGLDVFSDMTGDATFQLLNTMMYLLFYLALAGLLLGVASYVYVQYLKNRKGEDLPNS